LRPFRALTCGAGCGPVGPRAALRSALGYLILPRWGSRSVQMSSPMQTNIIYPVRIAGTKHGRCSVARNKLHPTPRAALRSALGCLILPRWGNGRSTCVKYCRTDSRAARVCLRPELLGHLPSSSPHCAKADTTLESSGRLCPYSSQISVLQSRLLRNSQRFSPE
jgi:hypothetical protein